MLMDSSPLVSLFSLPLQPPIYFPGPGRISIFPSHFPEEKQANKRRRRRGTSEMGTAGPETRREEESQLSPMEEREKKRHRVVAGQGRRRGRRRDAKMAFNAAGFKEELRRRRERPLTGV